MENTDENVPAGSVISQSPTAGTPQKKGSTVTIYVSTGKKDIKVTLNGNGGTASTGVINVHANEPYGTIPEASRDGYKFEGWFTAATEGKEITSTTTVTETLDHTLYARWSANSYTVKFEANGGSVSKTSKTVVHDDVYGDLPTPTRNGYGFDGWYTAADGGTKILPTTTVNITSEQKLYAHWSAGKLTGNGSLVVNESRSSQTGIIIQAEWSKSCLMVDGSVTLEIYGTEGSPAVDILYTYLETVVYMSSNIKLDGGSFKSVSETAGDGTVYYSGWCVDESGANSDHITFSPK